MQRAADTSREHRERQRESEDRRTEARARAYGESARESADGGGDAGRVSESDGHASESGGDRGRHAEAPQQIPAKGWKDVLWRVKDEMGKDNLGLVAAGVAFFAILALFPTLIAAISVYGLVFSPDEVQEQIAGLSDILPTEAREVLLGQLGSIVSRADTTLSWSAAFAILLALWSASSGTAKMMMAIGITYDEKSDRGFIKERGLALLLTVGFLVGTAVAVGLIAVLPAVGHFLGLGEFFEVVLLYGRWPVLALLAMAGLSLLYNVAPSRDRPKWRWVTWGAGVTTVLWLAASFAFSLYVQNFASFGETYGTLAGVIVLMLWIYLSTYVILIGAELNAELEAQTKQDSTVGKPQPMGQRNAQKADVLGPAHH